MKLHPIPWLLSALAAGCLTGAANAQVTYCTAKNNSLGCTPAMIPNGTSSSAAHAGFTLSAVNELSNKVGFLIYSAGGRAAIPFHAGTLCMNGPYKKFPLNSGGNPPPADCSGVYLIDMNTFAQGDYHPLPPPYLPFSFLPAPYLLIPSTPVCTQMWGRDNGFPFPLNDSLSDAVEYIVGP